MAEHKEGKCHLPNTDCDTVITIGMEMSSKQRLPSHLGKLKIFPANIAKPIVENTTAILVTIHQNILPANLPVMIRVRLKFPALKNTIFAYSYMSNPYFTQFSMNLHCTRTTVYENKALQGVTDLKLEPRQGLKLSLLNSEA